MAVYPRGRGFQASFMIKGERYRETFPTKEEAEKWEARVREAVQIGKPLPEAKTVNKAKVHTMGQLADYTMRHHYSKMPAMSVGAQRTMNHILEFTGTDLDVTDMTSQKIDEMVEHFQLEHGNTLATVNRKMAVLSKMFWFATKKLQVLDTKPEIPRFKETASVIRWLEEDEEDKLVKAARSFGMDDLSDFIIFAIDTGARYSEVAKSPWSWFSPDLSRWNIWLTKNNKPRVLPLTKRVQEILRRRKAAGQHGPFYKLDYMHTRRDFIRLCEASGIEGVTIHVLRHTCASRLVQRGVDIRRVQLWMGHATVTTTLRYAHLAPDHLNDVVNVLEPAPLG